MPSLSHRLIPVAPIFDHIFQPTSPEHGLPSLNYYYRLSHVSVITLAQRLCHRAHVSCVPSGGAKLPPECHRNLSLSILSNFQSQTASRFTDCIFFLHIFSGEFASSKRRDRVFPILVHARSVFRQTPPAHRQGVMANVVQFPINGPKKPKLILAQS